MEVRAESLIQASPSDVWNVVTDIEGSVETVKAITSIDVLERPSSGFVGFKWRETRIMFGKEATETMTVTEAKENEFYQTHAASHGSIYTSRVELSAQDNGTLLVMKFSGEPQSLGAKIMSATMGRMFKGATQKAIQKDLDDIRDSLESKGSVPP